MHRDPIDGVKVLTAFTYYMAAMPAFIKMALAEKLQHGEFFHTIDSIPRSSRPLVDSIQTLLDQGEAANLVCLGIDAMQFYVSIVALNFVHLPSRYALSVICGIDLSSQRIVVERKQHVVDLIETYVRSASNGEPAPPPCV